MSFYYLTRRLAFKPNSSTVKRANFVYIRRRFTNYLNLITAVLATVFGLFWLGWLLLTLLSQGIQAIEWSIFIEATPAPGSSGGLGNAILGSFLITLFGILIGAPIGVLAGTFLAEFGQRSKLASAVRFLNDLLLSAPSIIIGIFIYAIFVLTTGHFSGWAGSAALAAIVIPIVVRTTENMLKLVPNELRESAAALGAPARVIVTSIVWRAAKNGIITGILLGLARITGETAPLLFTALNNQFWSWDMSKPIANLPVTIFQFAMSPYDNWQQLAWGGALIITSSVLFINICARLLLKSR